MSVPPFFASRAAWIVLRLACLAVLALEGCTPPQGNTLVVGMELSSPPFEMTDEHNQPTGIGVDLARALAAYLHKDLVIQNTKFEGLIPALRTDRINLIISSMTATEERAQTISFSDPYVHISICLLVGANSGLRAGDDLNQPQAACVLEVIQGKADAFIYDQMSVYQLQKRNAATTRAIFQPLQRENWAIGIGRKHPELCARVNAFLADFKAKHALESLAAKYLNDPQALQAMGDPFSF